MAREFAKGFYKSKKWETARELALMRDNYLCVLCGRPAQEVHHIKHLTPENINDPNVSENLDNLMCLCRECHIMMHKKNTDVAEEYAFDENGMLIQVNR